jgi:hypothetical protein
MWQKSTEPEGPVVQAVQWWLAHGSQVKLRYGDHRQQPQQHSRYDELEQFPMSKAPVHGQPPSAIKQNTLSRLRFDDRAVATSRQSRNGQHHFSQYGHLRSAGV